MTEKVYKSKIEPFAKWHKGRNCYAVWMYRFEDLRLKQLMVKLQKELSQLIAFHPFTKPHLTVATAGFPSKVQKRHDDISYKDIIDCAANLQEQSFEQPVIRLKKLATFPHCAYIECVDLTPSSINLNKNLNKQKAKFAPHISLGVYLEDKHQHELESFFSQEIAQIDLTVRSLECVSFSSKALGNIPICPEDYQTIASVNFKTADLSK